MITLILFNAMLLNGCALVPQKVAMDDPEVQPLLQAAASFDRASYGFSPIPKSADVRLERRHTTRYDVMLHIAARTVRTIAFRRDDDTYIWIGEQESFVGPKKYKTVDGTFNEAIVLTYETQKVSGYPLNQLNVTYHGDDPRLADRSTLTLSAVKPILNEWGY
jgi:hypothetical protein